MSCEPNGESSKKREEADWVLIMLMVAEPMHAQAVAPVESFWKLHSGGSTCHSVSLARPLVEGGVEGCDSLIIS